MFTQALKRQVCFVHLAQVSEHIITAHSTFFPYLHALLIFDSINLKNIFFFNQQAARSALLSYEDVSQMLSDLKKIDFGQILSKAFFISGNSETFYKAKICKFFFCAVKLIQSNFFNTDTKGTEPSVRFTEV